MTENLLRIKGEANRLVELAAALNATENIREIYGITMQIEKHVEVLSLLQDGYTSEEQGFDDQGYRRSETSEELKTLTDRGLDLLHTHCGSPQS